MEMEFINILRVLWHWRSLIISMLIVATVALVIRMRVVDPIYEANVTLQLTTPQIEDVELFERYRYVEVRDQVSVARNNLTQVILSSEIYNQTINQLELTQEQLPYEVEVNPIRDSDFINVVVKSSDPDLAAEIANVHVNAAVLHYGELRSKPANAERDLIYSQLQAAEEEYLTVESKFNDYKARHNINDLDSEIYILENFLEQLKFERDREIFDRAVAVDLTAADISDKLDELITARENELQRLVELEPSYLLLETQVAQARDKYQYIKEKYDEAQLKVFAIQASNFIQIVTPANTPTETDTDISRTLVIPLIGTFGFAIILAFLLEYLLGLSERRTRSAPSAKSDAPLAPSYGTWSDPTKSP
jgi:capsular polysaccharide biosynthesis protein